MSDETRDANAFSERHVATARRVVGGIGGTRERRLRLFHSSNVPRARETFYSLLRLTTPARTAPEEVYSTAKGGFITFNVAR